MYIEDFLTSALHVAFIVVLEQHVVGSISRNNQIDSSNIEYARQQSEFCETEVMEASCGPGRVIVMMRSVYGRMKVGRCVDKDYGFIGCYKDVLHLTDRKCSGRRDCSVLVPNPEFKLAANSSSCPRDFMPYLEAEYECIRVQEASNQKCLKSRYLLPDSESFGYISSVVTHESGRGSTDCPWLIQARKGQNINITLIDFSRDDESSGTIVNKADRPTNLIGYNVCLLYAVLIVRTRVTGENEGELKQRGREEVPVCAGTKRERTVYTSHGEHRRLLERERNEEVIINEIHEHPYNAVIDSSRHLGQEATMLRQKSDPNDRLLVRNRKSTDPTNPKTRWSEMNMSSAVREGRRHGAHDVRHAHVKRQDDGHIVEIRIIRHVTHTLSPASVTNFFLLKYEITGCVDPVLPENAWITRHPHDIVIGCIDTDQRWQLFCIGSTWQGSFGNCTNDGSFPMVGSSQMVWSNFFLSFEISLIAVLSIAFGIGLVVLIVGTLCVSKRRGKPLAMSAVHHSTYSHNLVDSLVSVNGLQVGSAGLGGNFTKPPLSERREFFQRSEDRKFTVLDHNLALPPPPFYLMRPEFIAAIEHEYASIMDPMPPPPLSSPSPSVSLPSSPAESVTVVGRSLTGINNADIIPTSLVDWGANEGGGAEGGRENVAGGEQPCPWVESFASQRLAISLRPIEQQGAVHTAVDDELLMAGESLTKDRRPSSRRNTGEHGRYIGDDISGDHDESKTILMTSQRKLLVMTSRRRDRVLWSSSYAAASENVAGKYSVNYGSNFTCVYPPPDSSRPVSLTIEDSGKTGDSCSSTPKYFEFDPAAAMSTQWSSLGQTFSNESACEMERFINVQGKNRAYQDDCTCLHFGRRLCNQPGSQRVNGTNRQERAVTSRVFGTTSRRVEIPVVPDSMNENMAEYRAVLQRDVNKPLKTESKQNIINFRN